MIMDILYYITLDIVLYQSRYILLYILYKY